jgi:hypothetical protein
MLGRAGEDSQKMHGLQRKLVTHRAVLLANINLSTPPEALCSSATDASIGHKHKYWFARRVLAEACVPSAETMKIKNFHTTP